MGKNYRQSGLTKIAQRKSLVAVHLDQQIEQTEITPISGIEYRCPATWMQRRRQLNDSMWYWIQEGSGHCWIGEPENLYTLNTGDLFMIPQGVRHETWPDKGVCVRTTTVHFLARVNGQLDMLFLLGISGMFPSTPHAPYAESSQTIAREYALKAPGWRWAMSSAIKEVLLYIIRHHSDRLNLPDNEFHKEYLRLRPVIELVQNRLDDPNLTVADLAQAIFISEVYLRKLFQQTLRLSPIEFITQQRIERARVLLKTTDLSIKAVCDQCGFRDIHFFYRIFRKVTKSTPLAYRQSSAKWV
ncbi:MAG: AraC family transcriptional regulator [Phycisphaerae bacterium]